MNIEKIIRDWATKAVYNSIHCKSEEDVRDYLVTPFFEKLGFVARDPRVFTPEYRIDTPLKSPGRADLMLFAKGRPEIVVECKRLGRNLNDPSHWKQLADYAYAVPDVSVGVLTNGLVYKFYAETDVPDKLDPDPFLEIDLNVAQNRLTDTQVEFFTNFVEVAYDEGFIGKFATNELVRKRMIAWLSKELKQPSDEFCRLALKGQNVTRVRNLDDYKVLLKDAFAHGLAAQIYEQIQKPMRQASEGAARQAKLAAGVKTTPQELKIFEYIKQRIRHLGGKGGQDAAELIYYADSSKKFSVYYALPRKGWLLDYYELNGEDKFAFPHEISPHEVSGINNIDKPLMAILKNRLERAKSWNLPNRQGYGR